MPKKSFAPPVILSIAGSDNSCGAGIQADLKTISALGGYGLTAVTCVVAEVPGRVEAIQPMRPEVVASQVRLCFEAFPVAAAKTGMLYSTAIIRAVAREIFARPTRPPLVVDPVMVASSGDPLLQKSALAAYRNLLFPLAALVTPNVDELRVLSGQECRTLPEIESAGKSLAARHQCPFLLKGGHLRAREAVDLLVFPDGASQRFSAPFRRGADTHGTGCTFSAAIAVGLGAGLPLPEAVAVGKQFISRAIDERLRWGATSALNHFAAALPGTFGGERMSENGKP